MLSLDGGAENVSTFKAVRKVSTCVAKWGTGVYLIACSYSKVSLIHQVNTGKNSMCSKLRQYETAASLLKASPQELNLNFYGTVRPSLLQSKSALTFLKLPM